MTYIGISFRKIVKVFILKRAFFRKKGLYSLANGNGKLFCLNNNKKNSLQDRTPHLNIMYEAIFHPLFYQKRTTYYIPNFLS